MQAVGEKYKPQLLIKTALLIATGTETYSVDASSC